MAHKLTQDLLSEFEQRLNEIGVLALRDARPGLSEDQMDAILAPQELSLPAEARLWWGWHDGVAESAGPAATELGPARKWLPLSEALAHRATFGEFANLGGGGADEWATRLPLILAGGLYVIEADEKLGDECPVWVLWPDDGPSTPPAVESIGRLVELWLEAIDSGAWSFDPQSNVWQVDHERREALPAAKQGIV